MSMELCNINEVVTDGVSCSDLQIILWGILKVDFLYTV